MLKWTGSNKILLKDCLGKRRNFTKKSKAKNKKKRNRSFRWKNSRKARTLEELLSRDNMQRQKKANKIKVDKAQADIKELSIQEKVRNIINNMKNGLLLFRRKQKCRWNVKSRRLNILQVNVSNLERRQDA